MDEWIEIPNWDTYQHYKHRDPVWLRDYVRQLWNRQWLGLTLPQRGLLWTARLAYAHHNGQLHFNELQAYLPGLHRRYERANERAIAKRLNQAGLIDLVASTPLSLKDLKPVHARELPPNGRVPPCPACGIGGGFHLTDCPTLKGATT